MAFARLLFSLSAFIHSYHLVSAQPAYVYNNDYGVVNISGAENDGTRVYNWTLKYPLGFLCEDPNWKKIVIINMTAVTVQADLVLAIGTSDEYFAVAIPYDGGMRIPLYAKDANGEYTIATTVGKLGNYSAYSGLSVVPPSGSPLLDATTTLEEQYTTDTDFRRSLVPSKDAWEWEHLVDYDSPMYGGPIAQNTDLLTLEIFGDRVTDRSQLVILKNGLNVSMQMTSTWSLRVSERMFLFMGMDAAVGQQEIFELSRIDSIDECTVVTIPTPPTTQPSRSPSVSPTLPTVEPSNAPTTDPSATPTSETAVPSSDPTAVPTRVVTLSPSDDPTKFVTSEPTAVPSGIPTEVPSSQGLSEAPTVGRQTMAPSMQPTKEPSEEPSEVPSAEPSSDPSESPSRSPLPFGQTHAPVTSRPTMEPTVVPTTQPTEMPSVVIVGVSSDEPTKEPTVYERPQTTLDNTSQATVLTVLGGLVVMYIQFLMM